MKHFIAIFVFFSILSPRLALAQAGQNAVPQLETSQKVIDDEDFLFDDIEAAESDESVSGGQPPMLTPAQSAPPPPPSDVKIKEDLTSTIAENAEGDSPKEKGKTWVDTINPLSMGNTPALVGGDLNSPDVNLEGMVQETKKQQKQIKKKGSNAAVFNISGIMLRMNLTQAEKALMSRGYKKTAEKFEIPNFIKWRNEENCRNQGVVGYERLDSCVVELSKNDGHQYIGSVTYNKYDTNEEVVVKLTSNFTNNKIYRIYYRSLSVANTGNSQKATYLRNIKVYDFWKNINQKYGVPDNREDAIWTLGDNMPFLQAATGKLLLEDPMLKELDYTRMSREDQRYLNTDLYNF